MCSLKEAVLKNVAIHLEFYNQPVYKQRALGCQINMHISGLNPISAKSNENYRLKKTKGVFPL